MKFFLLVSLFVALLTTGTLHAAPLPHSRQLVVNTSRLQLTVGQDGCIKQLIDKRGKRILPIQLQTKLSNCTGSPLRLDTDPDGSILLIRLFTVSQPPTDTDSPPRGLNCLVIEQFTPSGDDICWTVEVRNQSNQPWSTTVTTDARVIPDSTLRFWTSWGDPRVDAPRPNRPDTLEWADPLVMQPLHPRTLWYGAPMYAIRQDNLVWNPSLSRHYFGVPLFALANSSGQWGFSVGFSPDDIGIEANLITTAEGVTFNRFRNRFAVGGRTTFTTYLRVHEANWRAALGAYVRQHSSFFSPPNPRIHEFEGTGSYSCAYDSLNAPKLRQMSYRTNWDATFGTLYKGVFLPPGPDSTSWQSWRGEAVSVTTLDTHHKRFQEQGFHVLNYFNVTEYGNKVMGRQAYYASRNPPTAIWMNLNRHLHEKLEPAVVYNPNQPTRYIYAPDRSVVVDPGEPVYRSLMIEQVQRHLDRLPHFEGFAVGGGDWLRLYNLRRDDGLTWFEGHPARSLGTSWKQLLDTLGPMLHRRDKVLMLNNAVKRLDHLRHVDGVFDEYGYVGASLNANAFLTVQKPYIGWCPNNTQLQAGGDTYLQRYLHLGAFPMAPFPANDHALRPDPATDQLFLDYGPLFDAIRGKQWVLEPDVVTVDNATANVNLFSTAPGTYVLPITMGGSARKVTVCSPKLASERVVEFIHPGTGKWLPLRAQGNQLTVPLYRGCALVRITN